MEGFDIQIKKNPKAYINFLQYQNRARKQVEQPDKESQLKKEREEAFNLYLHGANEDRIKDQRKREKIKQLRDKSQGPGSRRKWDSDLPKTLSKPKLKNSHPDAYPPSPDSQETENSYSKMYIKSQKDEIINYLSGFDSDRLNSVLLFLDNLLSSEFK